MRNAYEVSVALGEDLGKVLMDVKGLVWGVD